MENKKLSFDNPKPIRILLGCEESQEVAKAFRAKGFEAYSCDLKECSGGHPEWHFKMDVLEAIKGGLLVTQSGALVAIRKWDAGFFFPDCTYITCSAEWAYTDGPYHQKVKPGTLVGAARRSARTEALNFIKQIVELCLIQNINHFGFENPVGVIPKILKLEATQYIQPHDFGEDASKKTGLWLSGLPKLKKTTYCPPRMVNGKKRWANQTDSGQNKLSPGDKRAENRSKFLPGVSKAMAQQWGKFLNEQNQQR